MQDQINRLRREGILARLISSYSELFKQNVSNHTAEKGEFEGNSDTRFKRDISEGVFNRSSNHRNRSNKTSKSKINHNNSKNIEESQKRVKRGDTQSQKLTGCNDDNHQETSYLAITMEIGKTVYLPCMIW